MFIRRYNVVMSERPESLLYARVEAVLAGEITIGDLKVGDQLPTEDSLILRFGVRFWPAKGPCPAIPTLEVTRSRCGELERRIGQRSVADGPRQRGEPRN
jgi:hypothetical protein